MPCQPAKKLNLLFEPNKKATPPKRMGGQKKVQLIRSSRETKIKSLPDGGKGAH